MSNKIEENCRFQNLREVPSFFQHDQHDVENYSTVIQNCRAHDRDKPQRINNTVNNSIRKQF